MPNKDKVIYVWDKKYYTTNNQGLTGLKFKIT